MNLELPTKYKLDKEGRQNLKEIAAKLPEAFRVKMKWTKGQVLIDKGHKFVNNTETGLQQPIDPSAEYRTESYLKVNHFHNLKELFRCHGSEACRQYVADVTGNEELRNKAGIVVVGTINEYLRKKKNEQ